MNNPTGVQPGYDAGSDYRGDGTRTSGYQTDAGMAADHQTDGYRYDDYWADDPRPHNYRSVDHGSYTFEPQPQAAANFPVGQFDLSDQPQAAPATAYASAAVRPGNKTLARGGLALIAAAVLLDAVAFVVDVLAGLRIVRGVPAAEVGFEYGSSLSRLANVALPAAVAVGGIAFLLWFYGAYRARGSYVRIKHKPIWAVLGWVIPGINLVRPPQIMSELTRRSPLVGSWWALWAVGAVAHVALRLITPAVQRGWVYWQTTAFVADMALLASLAIAFALVGEADRSLTRPINR